MKTRFSGILKWLALAGFLLAAGSFYSCGLSGSNGAGLVRAEENVEPVAQEEPAAVARQETATGGNTDETAPGVVEEREEITSAAVETTGAERTADAQTIYIYICGEILHPGVYRMAEGQRIFEVVEMAGGFTELAANSWLNLAEAVYDGMKIEVPNQNQVQDEAWLAAHTAGGIADSRFVRGCDVRSVRRRVRGGERKRFTEGEYQYGDEGAADDADRHRRGEGSAHCSVSG